MTESKVIARIEGREITEAEVDNFIKNLGPQVAMQFDSEEGKKQIAEELVNQEVLYLDAVENKLEEEEAFLMELEEVKKNILKQYAINKVLQSVEVTGEDMKKFFEEHREHFKSQATVAASHILVETEEKAKEIKEKIEAGMSFEDAAKEFSTCPSNERGGELGAFPRGSMVPEFEEVAFELDLDVISEPVKSQFGYHLIKVTGKEDAREMEYEEVKPQIAQQLMVIQQQEKYLEKTNELKNKYKVEIL